MGKHLFFFCLLLFFGFSLNTVADDQTPTSRWDRSSAMAAVRSTDIEFAVPGIGDMASLADGNTTVARLKSIELRNDWPLPAREAAIYQFTQTLRTLTRDAVAVEIMQYLQSYQSRTLVPHEDHSDAYIPLFNIRGAAMGIENGWQRAEFAAEAFTLLQSSPLDLVSAFAQSSSQNQLAGYLDALKQAELADLITIQASVVERIEDEPGLTQMLALTASITADSIAIRQLLINGSGAGLSQALEQINTQLEASDAATLLTTAIHEAPASNAALAIAAWWPRLKHVATIRDLLIDQLADPQLGAAAALALSIQPDIQTIKLLQEAAGEDSNAARRAQMALEINRARPGGDF